MEKQVKKNMVLYIYSGACLVVVGTLMMIAKVGNGLSLFEYIEFLWTLIFTDGGAKDILLNASDLGIDFGLAVLNFLAYSVPLVALFIQFINIVLELALQCIPGIILISTGSKSKDAEYFKKADKEIGRLFRLIWLAPLICFIAMFIVPLLINLITVEEYGVEYTSFGVSYIFIAIGGIIASYLGKYLINQSFSEN